MVSGAVKRYRLSGIRSQSWRDGWYVGGPRKTVGIELLDNCISYCMKGNY
jgi:hypothetical protein